MSTPRDGRHSAGPPNRQTVSPPPGADNSRRPNARSKSPAPALWMRLMMPVLRMVVRALIASYRTERVEGREYLDALIQAQRPVLLCCWHQRLSVCVAYLLRHARQSELKPGFLVSPSRDGELVARVVARMGATVVRGSANRTGARALRDMYQIMRQGVSPILHPDGPHGPSRRAKTGSLLLAQMTRAAMLPMSFSADRYWQLNSWDRLIIPKPFARVIITIGEPIAVAASDDVEAREAVLNERLDALDIAADRAMGTSPRPGRR